MISRKGSFQRLSVLAAIGLIAFGGVAYAKKPSAKEIKDAKSALAAAQNALEERQKEIAAAMAHLNDPDPAGEDVAADCEMNCTPGQNPKVSGAALSKVGIVYGTAGLIAGGSIAGAETGGSIQKAPAGAAGALYGRGDETPFYLCSRIYDQREELLKTRDGTEAVLAAEERCGPVKRRMHVFDLENLLPGLKADRAAKSKALKDLEARLDCDDCGDNVVNTHSDKKTQEQPIGGGTISGGTISGAPADTHQPQ